MDNGLDLTVHQKNVKKMRPIKSRRRGKLVRPESHATLDLVPCVKTEPALGAVLNQPQNLVFVKPLPFRKRPPMAAMQKEKLFSRYVDPFKITGSSSFGKSTRPEVHANMDLVPSAKMPQVLGGPDLNTPQNPVFLNPVPFQRILPMTTVGKEKWFSGYVPKDPFRSRGLSPTHVIISPIEARPVKPWNDATMTGNDVQPPPLRHKDTPFQWMASNFKLEQ